jgi:hypothetical protein
MREKILEGLPDILTELKVTVLLDAVSRAQHRLEQALRREAQGCAGRSSSLNMRTSNNC